MKRALSILAVLLVAGSALAFPAFELMQHVAGTTTGINLYNPNIRQFDGKMNPYGLTTAPQIGEINLDDGTGETFTAPSQAVIKSATLTLAGAARGSVVIDAVNGTLTVKKPGLYNLIFCAGDGTGADTATQTITVFEKIGAASAAEPTQAIKAIAKTLTATPWVPLCNSGLVTVTASDAASTGNVIFDTRLTASTGNTTIKQFQFRAVKLDELDPPSVGP